MKRGSALVLAIWTIAVLSIMVISFVYEAHQQTGINIYVKERNRASHLIDAGKALAEIVLIDYKNAPDWSEDQEDDKLLEDDAWFKEKQDLKSSSRCTIGPVYLDEENPESSLITVHIESSNSGSKGVINLNEMYQSSDGTTARNVNERWWMIFKSHDIPEELSTPKEGRIHLWNILVASWKDWRDSDTTVTSIDGEECGAEDEWYEELEEKYQGVDEETKNELARRPRNDAVPDVHELAYVRGFRDYPEVLTSGVINPWDDEREQIRVRGIMDLFCAEGSGKININTCKSLDALITIPGIFDKNNIDRDDAVDEAKEVAQAILDALGQQPEDRDVDPTLSSWPFKDWDDMLKRVDLLHDGRVTSADIGMEAKEYLTYGIDDETLFKVTIEVSAGSMTRTVEANCYVKDGKVRYVKWIENPPTSGK